MKVGMHFIDSLPCSGVFHINNYFFNIISIALVKLFHSLRILNINKKKKCAQFLLLKLPSSIFQRKKKCVLLFFVGTWKSCRRRIDLKYWKILYPIDIFLILNVSILNFMHKMKTFCQNSISPSKLFYFLFKNFLIQSNVGAATRPWFLPNWDWLGA